MNDKRFFWNLTPTAINLLSGGMVFFITCVGVRVARSPELALKAANIQLNVSSTAKRLKKTSRDLEEQAEIIEAKDRAYQELLLIYQDSLKGKQGYGRLQNAIENIEDLPDTEDVEVITERVEEVEEDINLITVE